MNTVSKQVLLSFYENGEWVEKVYAIDDASWREALKLLAESSSQVKLNYKYWRISLNSLSTKTATKHSSESS